MFSRLFLLGTLLLCAVLGSSAQRKKPVRIEFRTTAGTFVVQLLEETPHHSANFEKLVRQGFYDGTLFHRVIKDFMVQAGDPNSKTAQPGQVLGEGDLGYTLPLELALPYYYHQRGALAMARESDEVNPSRSSSACQFYIVWGKRWSPQQLSAIAQRVDAATGQEGTITPDMRYTYQHDGGTPHLDGQYTVFGHIVSGLKVIGQMQAVATDAHDRPIEDLRILQARVVE